MSLRASAHTGVAIRIPWKAEPCVCLRHTDDPLGSCRSTSDKENGSPHQPAGWFAMTSIFWAFSTVCSPLREGAKASFSAFHNFKFLIRIKGEVLRSYAPQQYKLQFSLFDTLKNQAVAWFLCVCVGYLPGQAEKSPNLSVEALCSRYLSFWVGQRIVVA